MLLQPITLVVILFACITNAQAGITDTLFGPDNYWECLLDTMPGTKTYGGSMENLAQCQEKFPNASDYQLENSILGPKNFHQCMEKYASQTQEPLARLSIQKACYRLYPP